MHMKEGSMTLLAHRQLPPSARDSAIARDSGQRLSRYAHSKRPLNFRVETESKLPPIQLPPAAVALLMNILEAMPPHHIITIITAKSDLTTVQTAAVLN